MMADQKSKHVVFDAERLTDAQRDGAACVVCGDEYAPKVPVGMVDGGQVFACSAHGDCPTWCNGGGYKDGQHWRRSGATVHYGESIIIGDYPRDGVAVVPRAVIPDRADADGVTGVSMVSSRASVAMTPDDARELAAVIEQDMPQLAAALRSAVAVLRDESAPGAGA